MKKLIVIFLCVISLFSYYISYKQFENEQWKNISDYENFSDYSFAIAKDSGLDDPEEVYPIILQTAKELKVNIFRDVTLYANEESVELFRYVLITNDTELFRNIPLKHGRYLNEVESQGSKNFFLSSKEMKDKDQIGTFEVFGKNSLMFVKPLILSYSQVLVDGQYHVESNHSVQPNDFYETLTNNFNKTLNPEVPFTVDDFVPQEINDSEPYVATDIKTLLYIELILVLVVSLLVFYYILHRGKEIAIYKMQGVNSTRIWKESIGRLLFIVFIVTYAILLVFLICREGLHISFILKMTIQHFLNFIIIICSSLIALFYINSTKINTILKNRRDTKAAIVFNILLKITLSILSIIMLASLLNQISVIEKTEKELINWKKSADYAVFSPFYIGMDAEDLKKSSGSKTYASIAMLYSILNKEGSLFIHTKYYEQETLKLPFEGIRYISVNPNYLKKYPILSVDNKEIFVDEAIDYRLLLVPHQYKDKEQEILNYFNESYVSSLDYEKENVTTEIPTHLKKPDFHIIWTKDRQEIFSFNPEVFPNEKNMIIDPIIMVKTDNNMLNYEKQEAILGSGASDPLKVKLIDSTPELTYEKLKETLQELNLDDNLKYLVTIDHLIIKELDDLKQERLLTILVFISMLIGTIFVLIQNTILMFHNRKKLFIVRSLFGTGFFKTYRSILYILLGTWIVQIVIPLMITNTVSTSLVSIICILLIIEFLMFVLTVIILENKNKIRVLKGGA